MRLITFLCELRISGQRNSRELTNETPLKNETICNGYHCGIMAFLKFFTLRLRAGPRYLLGGRTLLRNDFNIMSGSFSVCFFCFVLFFAFVFLFTCFFCFLFFFLQSTAYFRKFKVISGEGAQLLYTSPRSAPAAMKTRIDQLNKKWRKRIIENSLAGPYCPWKGERCVTSWKTAAKGTSLCYPREYSAKKCLFPVVFYSNFLVRTIL